MKKWIIGFAVVMVVFIYVMNSRTVKLVKVTPEEVSRIVVLHERDGEELEITDREKIEHIIENLRSIKFKKGGSQGELAYSMKIFIYNQDGKRVNRFIILGRNAIWYKGFRVAENNKIDSNYIRDLLGKQ